MSFSLLYTFYESANQYDIYGDFDTLEVQVRQNNIIVSSGGTFLEADTGFGEGDVIKKQCEGFQLQQAEASLSFPYATLTIEENALFCGYAAEDTTCDLSVFAHTKNATNSDLNGRISVAVSPGGTYQYSINGLNWNTNNLFINIPAGNYFVYVRRPDGSCQTSIQTTVHKDVVDISPNYFPIPYQDSKHLCFFFRLIVNNVRTIIAEPIKWDGITISGERDNVFHGYKFKYTDSDTVLGFDCDGGRYIIEDVFNQYGEDGEVFFQYGYIYFGVEYILFPGKLILNTYKWYADRVECAVQVDDFDLTFQSRQETKVSMSANTSFEGTDIIPPNPYYLLFHPKTILTEFKVDNTVKSIFYDDPVRATEWSILPETVDGETSDIATSFFYPFGVISGQARLLNFYQVLFDFPGDTDIDFHWTLSGTIHIDNNGVLESADYNLNVPYIYQRYNAATDDYTETIEYIAASYTGTVGILSSTDLNFTLDATKTLTGFRFGAKDRIYFYASLNTSRQVKATFNITQSLLHLDIKQTQESTETSGNVWFIDDVLRQTLAVIADNRYVLRSTFFERASSYQLTDGCASKSALTNGFQIRSFDPAEKPLTIDFSTIINSLNAMYCIGINYATVNNVPIVRIERRDFFYQDKEIIQITTVVDKEYSEEVAKEIIYNDIEIGYDKFQEDGYNSLDEFNTKREWLTPIQKNKAKLEQLSKFITSGYRIEDVRRNQFNDQPQESVPNDDDPFFVALRKDEDAWVTEKDEAFDVVNNLISPETSYNLRVSPGRMLYNWFIWLKGIFTYKQPTDLITNTFSIQNGDLETQFNVDEPCRVGDVDRILINETADIPMARLTTTENLYSPEWVNVICRLTPDKVQMINMALSGQYGPSKDYGYIMVKRPNGGWQAGWPVNLKYNYSTEECTIKMLKKYYTPQPVDEDCCDWLIANGCYILANAEKLIA